MTTSTNERSTEAREIPAPARQPRPLADLGLLIGRLALAAVMIAHGAQKYFQNTVAGTQAGFEQMGIPFASAAAVGTIAVELIGGVALALGLLTRLVSLLYAGIMAGAIAFTHLPNGFYASDGGWEFVMVLGAVALLFVLTGPGRLSLDHAIIGRRRTA